MKIELLPLRAKVLLTVPAKDEIDATIVLGVNHGELEPGHRIEDWRALEAKVIERAWPLADDPARALQKIHAVLGILVKGPARLG